MAFAWRDFSAARNLFDEGPPRFIPPPEVTEAPAAAWDNAACGGANAERAALFSHYAVEGDLGVLEQQVLGSHWDSDAQRQRAMVEGIARAGVVDPDARDLLFSDLELKRRAHERVLADERVAAAEERDWRLIEKELLKEHIRSLGAPDLREYPVLNMHGAMASAVEPFFPLVELVLNLLPGVGVLVAAVEAIQGETLVTGQQLSGVERALGLVLAAAPMAVSLATAGPELVGMVVKEVVRRGGASVGRAAALVRGLARADVEGLTVLARAEVSAAEAARARKAVQTLTGVELREVRGGIFAERDIAESWVAETAHDPSTARFQRDVFGEGPAVDYIVERTAKDAGVGPDPYHHIFPQEERPWFAARGVDVDDFTIQLDRAHHEAIHGGGDWRLGKTWEEEWNRAIMERLRRADARSMRRFGRPLSKDEIIDLGRALMEDRSISGDLVRYPKAAPKPEVMVHE